MAAKKIQTTRKKIETEKGSISVCIRRPSSFNVCLIIANGAGAPMDSPFILHFCDSLAEDGVMTVSFNFPYQEKKRKIPDRQAVLEQTYLSVIDLVARESKLALSHIVIGGKSMGGRIATHIAPRANVGGLVLLGYPLHAVGKPDVVRDEHLYSIHVPCLFVSGDRDSLCTLALMKKVVSKMKRAAIFVVEDGDHSFKIRKNPARTQEHVFADVREQILLFLKKFK